MNRNTKKKFKLKKFIVLVCTPIIIIVTILILLLSKGKNNLESKLIGVWDLDGNTICEFEKNNTGFLRVPLADYKFVYEIDGEKLFIDFENDKSKDMTYTYKLEEDTLTLKNENGTFVFKRKN